MNVSELETFGFAENEAKIYLTLLEYGSMSPYELAEKTGLNRSYLYDLLNRMAENGRIGLVKVKGKAQFRATPPAALEEQFLLRASEFGKLVPALEALRREEEETSVELHKGKHVYKTLMKDQLSAVRAGSTTMIISADERQLEQVEPIMLQQFFRQLRERHVKERAIIKRGGYRFEQEETAYREIAPEIIGNTSLFIYGDKVAELVLGNPNYLVITKNREMAETKRKLFEHLWRQADAVR